MLIKRHYLGCLAHASYFIADRETQRAAIVDPRRDVTPYLEDARLHGVEVTDVILTAWQPETVAAALELRDRAGARIAVGVHANSGYPFTPVRDDDAITLGAVRLVIVETPGHIPGAISILVFDDQRSDLPHAVLTGAALLIGDVGRPDRIVWEPTSATEAAGILYDSLHAKLLALPDETLVYPSHGAGALCGWALSTDMVSTIGAQRRYNFALQPMPREAFVRMIVPDAHEAVATGRHRRHAARWPLPEVLAAERAGAQIVDVRDPLDFAAAHLVGSVNVAMHRIGAGVETVLTIARPIVVVASPGDENAAASRLQDAGFSVLAALEGGLSALVTRPDLVRRTIRVSALTLGEQLANGRSPLVIDVRSEPEWRAEHIAGSVVVPLEHLRERMYLIPYSHRLAVMSAHGYRSSAAASLLQAHGADVLDVVGGIAAWKASRLPTASEGAALPRSHTEAYQGGGRVLIRSRASELNGALCVELEQQIIRRHQVDTPVKQTETR